MERLALIADVHACEISLRAVLADIAQKGVERVFCLGDVVGYGPDPSACVELVRAWCEACVQGNHDAMTVAEGFPLEDFHPHISVPLLRAKNELTPDQLAWLRELPLTIKIGGFEACHASLDNPALFTHLRGRVEVERHFRHQTDAISLYGHTHLPAVFHRAGDGRLRFAKGVGKFALDLAGQYAVGVGSVGFPRDEDERACWVEFVPDEPTVTFHRVDADLGTREIRLRAMLRG